MIGPDLNMNSMKEDIGRKDNTGTVSPSESATNESEDENDKAMMNGATSHDWKTQIDLDIRLENDKELHNPLVGRSENIYVDTIVIPKNASCKFQRMNSDISALSLNDWNSPYQKNERKRFEKSNEFFQPFILGVAFLAVWTPQNVMAPNLTQMAEFFHFSDSERDFYLGANIAFATAFLSLPISGCIGFTGDIMSRRDLYALAILICGLAALTSGLSSTYTILYVSRLVTGGCMAGCTSLAFSLMGDLFEAKSRNVASSALTAMMGAGMILGQVASGVIGPWLGWQIPFFAASASCIISAILVILLVEEPLRGGKEEALKEVFEQGDIYNRKITFESFWHAVCHNNSNIILFSQAFFCSVPWGIIMVFLNDYLSQEQNLSVQFSTFMVAIFGVGSAFGAFLGGILGQHVASINISYLPIFMAVSTILGIVPFLALLDVSLENKMIAILLGFLGGMIANLPSPNIRPCLLNLNLPELRGATLTAQNLVINLARGIGPWFLTGMCNVFSVDRRFSFNALLVVFFSISAILLAFLAKTLPIDQDNMERHLAQYASALTDSNFERSFVDQDTQKKYNVDCDTSVVSMEDTIASLNPQINEGSWIFLTNTFRDMVQKSFRSQNSAAIEHNSITNSVREFDHNEMNHRRSLNNGGKINENSPLLQVVEEGINTESGSSKEK